MARLRTLAVLLNDSRSRANGGSNGGSKGAAYEARVGGRNGHAESNGHADVWDELRREIARSRRFGRSFALVRIGRISGTRLAPSMRTIDREWVANGVTYVLLPECDRAAGESLVARLRRELSDVLAGCAVAVASFPEDGLTSGALLKTLRTASDAARAAEFERPVRRIADASPIHADAPPAHA